MGDVEISKNYSGLLEHDLNDLQHTLNDVLNLYEICSQNYSNSMWQFLNESEYFSEDDLRAKHRNLRNESIRQVCIPI